MLQLFISQLKKFSKENWWVYALLFASLTLIFITGKGSTTEILLVFLVYFGAELCIMMMIDLIHKQEYKSSSVYQLLGNTIFGLLFLYHFITYGQAHYFLGSSTFMLGAVKNILFYYMNIHLKWINVYMLFVLGVLVYCIYYYINLSDLTLQIFFQSLGIIIFSSYLVIERKDKKYSYLWGLSGVTSMLIGSILGIYTEYNAGYIYGVTIAFFIMPLTVFVVYLKSFKKYLQL